MGQKKDFDWRERVSDALRAMRTEERLGLKKKSIHQSDCAIYNEPEFPAGPCDCSVSRA